MLRNLFLLTVFLFVISGNSSAQPDTILTRYRYFLVKSVEHEAGVAQLAASLNAKGQWDDIDYLDTEKANWKTQAHLKRVRDMALAWANPQSTLFHDKNTWKAIDLSLNHWLEVRYKNSNWWHNEIGIPQVMRDIIILLREKLSARQLKGTMEVLAQHRVQYKATGANLTWSADLGFHYGALTNDLELMGKCRELLLKEIRITTEEGIQPDYSFHQHGARLQMFQYGAAFLRENARLAWECRKTQWAYPKDKIEILSDFVLKGWQWMARGINTVPGTMDRSASRVGELQSPDLRQLIPYFCEIDPKNRNEFLSLSARQQGIGAPLKGFRHYPYSDFTAFQTAQFSFFLKTISTRTLVTESINNENLKGKLLNSGDAYIVRNGKEYFDLMPVWNWNLLPGLTVFDNAEKIVKQDFTGGASDGKSGLTVMDYQLKGTGEQLLKAKKFWACHNSLVVCLIAGLEAEHVSGEICTSLDQCRWQGDVTVNREGNVMKEGDHLLDNVRWIHHNGVAYIPIEPSPVALHLNASTSSWSSINVSGSTTPLTEKMFNPVMLHPLKQGGLNTGYVLASVETPAQANVLAGKQGWQVIRNDTACQAVRFKDGTCMVAFLSPGSVTIGKKKLAVDKPCLIMLRDGRLYASNPKGNEEILQVSFHRSTQKIPLPAFGLTTEVEVR